ncbi:MAG: cupin domain-containing protein [bacterium]
MGKIHKFKGKNGNFTWEGVASKKYPDDRAKNVIKKEMIGPKDGAKNFEIRYFEVAPGGFTALDSHEHDHGVLINRGKGKVLLNKELFEIGYGDAIYISPDEEHQFKNTGKEPLGFICVIPPKHK